MVSSGETESEGKGFTVTVTWDVAVHPSRSPTTVYVVVEDGVAVTFGPEEELSVADGLHV